ncbi:MAG: sigma-70 family RNA polymerase sigma factor [Acidobacteriota bacterium]
MNALQASAVVTSLFEGWYSILVRYVHKLTGSFDLAEDVAQEAMMLLYRELRSGRPVENPKGWTLCVARRQIHKQIRNYQSMDPQTQSLEMLESRGSSGTRWQEPVFDRHDSARLFSVLTTRELEVILLRMEAMKYREIAKQLGISPNSVNTLLARALRKLQRAAGTKAGVSKFGRLLDDEELPSKTLH